MNNLENDSGAEFLTKRQAAALAGVSCRTIDKWKSSMELPFIKAGALIRISKSDLLEWMQQHRKTNGVTQEAEGQNGENDE